MLRRLLNDNLKAYILNQLLAGKFSSTIIKLFNFVFHRIVYEKRKIIWIDELEKYKIKSIYKEELSYISPPRYTNIQPIKLSVVADAVNIYELKNIYAHPYSSHFLSEDNIYMERLQKVPIADCNYSTGFVLAHDTTQALIIRNTQKTIKLKEAIFIGGNGAFNYYHWMIEIIPKIEFFFNFFQGKPITILAPIEAKSISTFQEILTKCLNGITYKVFYLDKGYHAFVKNLYIATPSNNIVFNTKKNIINPNYGYYRNQSLDYLNQTLLLGIQKKNKTKYPEKIYLSRKEKSIRAYNQDEVQAITKKFNIENIFIEDYNLREQALIFSNAKVIIGPSGAAWTNIIFCRPHTLAISWLPKQYKEFSVFSTLAVMRNVNIVFIEAKIKNKNKLHSDYVLDCKEFENLLSRLIGD